MAAACFGEVGNNEGESRGRVREVGRIGTTLGHSPTRPEARRQVGGGVAPRARVRYPASAYWQRLGMTGTRPVGWAVHWASQVRAQVRLSLPFLIISVFYFAGLF